MSAAGLGTLRAERRTCSRLEDDMMGCTTFKERRWSLGVGGIGISRALVDVSYSARTQGCMLTSNVEGGIN